MAARRWSVDQKAERRSALHGHPTWHGHPARAVHGQDGHATTPVAATGRPALPGLGGLLRAVEGVEETGEGLGVGREIV